MKFLSKRYFIIISIIVNLSANGKLIFSHRRHHHHFVIMLFLLIYYINHKMIYKISLKFVVVITIVKRLIKLNSVNKQ